MSPLNIPVLCSDVSLFMDMDHESHCQAINKWFETFKTSSNSSIISSITIVVFETGIFSLLSDHEPSEPQCATQKYSQLKMTECIMSIQSHLEGLARNYQCNQKHNGELHKQVIPLALRLEVMELHPVSYHKIIQKWIRSLLFPSSGGYRMCFNLPETMDGTQCSIALDVEYTIFPHRMDSIIAKDLITDLKLLSYCTIKVEQLVSLSDVDGSLIYGIPLMARPGFENDLDQYNDMQILVHQLWKYLDMKDVAMLLRCKYTGTEHYANTNHSRWFDGNNHANEQLFLLMVEDSGTSKHDEDTSTNVSGMSQDDRKSIKKSTSRGILYRYASSVELLQHNRGMDIASEQFFVSAKKTSDGDNDDEMQTQYFQCIEKSLDYLEKSQVNPYLTGT